MTGFILGKKQKQEQMFDESGNLMPVTIIHTSPCYLVGIKTKENDGYNAVKLGFGNIKQTPKPVEGELKKAGIKTPLRFLREVRTDKAENIEIVEEGKKKGIKIGENTIFIGEEVKPAALFQLGDIVDVSGTSKGKGFQGVVRRHGFRGGPRTHGQSDRERAPGSIGSGTTPGRVKKGLRMAGRMGGERITVSKLKVMKIEDDSIIVKGLIPGHVNGLVEVRSHKLK